MSKHDIFQIMNDYHSDNEILKSEAKKAVIEDYSKFVSYIIKEKFYSYRKHWEDLFQCGICGLLKALENYDPYFSKPTTYFYYFIVQEINDFISKYIEGTNRYYSRKVKSLDESILKLKRSGIPEPSARELAKVMNLKETSARNLIRIKHISQPISLDYLIENKLYITFFLSFHILSNVRKALFYRLYGHFHFLFTFAYRGISSYVFPLKRGKFRGKYSYAIRRFISVLALSIEECAYQSIVILILE